MNFLITGATGFIGQRLVARLKTEHRIKVLSRNRIHAERLLGVPVYDWNYSLDPVPAEALEDTQVIIHLMGENLGNGRWTEQRKQEIYQSRILSTRKLVEATTPNLKRFICGSAIGIYPGIGDAVYDETFVVPTNGNFMQIICRDWEDEVRKIENKGVRSVSIRTGVVLGLGGMLEKLLPLFKLGLGGSIGDGKQWLPWIHIDDLVSVFIAAALNDRYQGPVNAVSPNPTQYQEFSETLGKVLHRPTFLTIPAFILKLALGEAAALALNSYRIEPAKLIQSYDFHFKFTQLGTALENIIQKS